jgi:hypothetical protein
MAGVLLRQAGRMAITLWAVATAVFAARHSAVPSAVRSQRCDSLSATARLRHGKPGAASHVQISASTRPSQARAAAGRGN